MLFVAKVEPCCTLVLLNKNFAVTHNMFGLFKSEDKDDLERAKSVFEKILTVPRESKEARSMRMRVGLLSRAFLDKAFIAGAEQTEAFEVANALAITKGTARPVPPTATEFQTVQSTTGAVTAYLPMEYAQEAFTLGGQYQKTEITAEQAISAMQTLADKIFLQEIKMEQPLQVLQFLRDEIGFTAHKLDESQGDV